MAMLDPILPRLWQLARRLKTAGSAPGQNFKRSGVFPSRKGQAKTCQFRGWARKTLIATFSVMKGNALLKITGETVMQTITSALVALVLLTGIVGSAQALDARDFYEQVDRYHY
jgi:ABC-type arginine/histidine transport system permease subunit